jgi:CAAX protease family protein
VSWRDSYSKKYLLMIGILVQLALSWLIIWIFQKKNLSVLGFRPTKRRILDFIFFLLIAAILCANGFFMRMYFANEKWQINPALNFNLVLNGIWWNVKSVLFEELIFRGVILYILIKKWGALPAIIISACAFGIYHWFSFGIFGNVQQMIILFIVTGLMGLLLAYAYAKTFSLYIPIAIHFGWNFTQQFIFSQGSIGKGIFILKEQPTMQVSYFIYFCITFLPMLSFLIINFLIVRKLTWKIETGDIPKLEIKNYKQ